MTAGSDNVIKVWYRCYRPIPTGPSLFVALGCRGIPVVRLPYSMPVACPAKSEDADRVSLLCSLVSRPDFPPNAGNRCKHPLPRVSTLSLIQPDFASSGLHRAA